MRRLALALTSAVFAVSAGSAFAAEDTFTATVTTQAGISVDCSTNDALSFGTLAIEAGNDATTVTLASDNTDATTSGSTDVTVVSAGASAKCAVTGENGDDGTASLSGGGGSFSGTTLSGVELTDGTTNISADLELNKVDTIGNETLFIGGVLSIPTSFVDTNAHGTYTSASITLSVIDN